MNKADDFLLTFTDQIVEEIYKDLTERKHKPEPEISEVMPLLLFKTILDKIHTIKLLVETGEPRVGESTFSIARTICECKWYLIYMIKSDTDFKARSYYYFSRLDEAKNQIDKLKYLLSEAKNELRKRKQSLENLEEKMELYDKALKAGDTNTLAMLHNGQRISPEDLKEGKSITTVFTSKQETYKARIDKLNTQIPEMSTLIQEYEQRISALKSNPNFADVRTEIGKIPDTLPKLKQYPTWYSLKTHIPNVRQLTKHLRLLREYEGAYGSYSQDIHILNATKQVRLKEEKAVLKDADDSSTNSEAFEAYYFSISVLSSVVGDFLLHYGKAAQKKELEEHMATLSAEKQ